jgi:hypothetical protein
MENRITITVTLFGEDSSFGSRRRFRDLINAALEQAQLGTYVGGGTMVTDEPHYNIEYEVTDESQGLTLICNTLRALGVGPTTELSVGRDTRYSVYDDTWTNLGHRPPSSSQPPVAANMESTPSASPEDLRARLQVIMDEVKKKYGGPKDPNREA